MSRKIVQVGVRRRRRVCMAVGPRCPDPDHERGHGTPPVLHAVKGGPGVPAHGSPGEGERSPGLPFESVIVAGEDAASRMSSLRSWVGCVPVVLGAPTRWVSLAQLLAGKGSFDDTLSKGLALNVDQWIHGQRAREPDYDSAGGSLTDAAPMPARRQVVSSPMRHEAPCTAPWPWIRARFIAGAHSEPDGFS